MAAAGLDSVRLEPDTTSSRRTAVARPQEPPGPPSVPRDDTPPGPEWQGAKATTDGDRATSDHPKDGQGGAPRKGRPGARVVAHTPKPLKSEPALTRTTQPRLRAARGVRLGHLTTPLRRTA